MSYIGKQPRKAALTSSDIEDGIITAAKIEDGAVVAAEIASNAVTTAKINADAVTGAKIADDAINSEHYTDGSIDTAHIAADQITNAKIADDQIDSEHYVDGSIDTAHIADNQITLAKLAGGTDGNIISYDASGDPVAIATGSDGQVLTSTGAGSPPAFETAAAGGKIGQIVSTTKLDSYSASVASAAVTGIVTGFTVAITPSASNSKILIILNVITGASGEHGMRMELFRDTTKIDLADASSSRGRNSKGVVQMSGGSSYASLLSTNFLDAPNSTSELVYGIKIGTTSSGSQSVYVNRSHTDDDNAKYGRSTSTITVMEVLA